MVDNFDALLEQALAEFKSNGPIYHDQKTEIQNYASLLQEISEDDEELAKAEISTIPNIEDNKISDSEPNYLLDELQNDSNNWFNKSEWHINSQGEITRENSGELFAMDDKGIVAVSENPQKSSNDQTRAERLRQESIRYKHNRDLHKIEINRMAFDQKILPLSDKITLEHKRLIIELLTMPLRELIVKYENYVNKRIEKLLMPVIPAAVKLANAKWPWIFIQNPGFLYKTRIKLNGESKTFWAEPKVPYYFKQGTEQAVLEERDISLAPYFLDSVDRAIFRWYATREKLAEREVHFASKMINIKGNTYYHLLMLNPFWFEKLYEHVKNELL